MLTRIKSIKKIQFKPALIPTVVALAMIALTLYLSSWQTSRAAQKSALQASYDARVSMSPLDLNKALQSPLDAFTIDNLRFRTATITGEWLNAAQFVIDNKQQDAQPGYHVITPLRLNVDVGVGVDAGVTGSGTPASGGSVILVNRGWVPRTRNYPALPLIAPPQAVSRYLGVLVLPTKKYLELGANNAATDAATAKAANKTTNKVWQNLDVQRLAAATGLKIFPLVMLLNSTQAAPANAPLAVTAQASLSPVFSPVEQVETPDAGVDKHRGYAFQWLALAIAIGLVWLVVNVKITRR